MTETPSLHREVSGGLLFLYGLGTMLGAGIYALIGEIAAEAGVFGPVVFLIAALLAAFTCASFAELASRFPKAAGEAVYVTAGFDNQTLGLVVGVLIVISGVLSSGVMLQGLVGYAHEFVGFPDLLGLAVLTFLIGALAIWGIGESLAVVGAITVIEVAALLVIIVLGAAADIAPPPAPAQPAPEVMVGVLSAAVLAFYAFIGFEDMVNIAEEVERPRQTMPVAIFGALAAATALYLAVTWVAVRTTPIAALSASDAPMALVLSTITGRPSGWLAVVALFALANGALAQVVMASRVLYGLARQGHLPFWIGTVNGVTRTPVYATIAIAAGVFAVSVFPLSGLAKATSLALLIVFTLVNLALIRIQRNDPTGECAFRAPPLIPWLGAASCAAFAAISIYALIPK